MKKQMRKKGIVKFTEICLIRKYQRRDQAEAAIRLLEACGIKAATEAKKLGNPVLYGGKETPLYVLHKHSWQASDILELATILASKSSKTVQLPPEEGTLEMLDMLIHDCRQYLMIATGELKSIEEEGELELDDPTNDLEKITIRLKRLKDQCMRQARLRPLDWQR